MVRRGLKTASPLVLALTCCQPQAEMAESVDMPDTMAVQQAIQEPARRGALLDTMPGGEMAIGDSAMEVELLEGKARSGTGP